MKPIYLHIQRYAVMILAVPALLIICTTSGAGGLNTKPEQAGKRWSFAHVDSLIPPYHTGYSVSAVRADRDYIYTVEFDPTASAGWTLVVYARRDHRLVAIVASTELGTVDRQVTALAAGPRYCYLGTEDGRLVIVSKKDWAVHRVVELACALNDLFQRVTGIVDRGDGYVYCSLYMPRACDYFYKVDPDRGEITASLDAPDSMHNLVTDGTYLYSLSCSAFIPVIDPETMEYVEFIYPGFGELPAGIAVDRRYIYCGTLNGTVFKYDLSLREVVAISGYGTGLNDARDIFFAGTHIYVSDWEPRGMFRFDRKDLGDPAELYLLTGINALYVDRGYLFIACDQGTKIEYVRQRRRPGIGL